MVTYPHHGNGTYAPRYCGQEANLERIFGKSVLRDLREPETDSVIAHYDAEIDERQEPNFRTAEGVGKVVVTSAGGMFLFLLLFQAMLEKCFFIGTQPF